MCHDLQLSFQLPFEIIVTQIGLVEGPWVDYSTGVDQRRKCCGHRNGCASMEHNTFWNQMIFVNQ